MTYFAGGVTVAYVFLHMLPEIVENHDKLHHLLEKSTTMSPFKDLAVFAIALVGFQVFYILDRQSSVLFFFLGTMIMAGLLAADLLR